MQEKCSKTGMGSFGDYLCANSALGFLILKKFWKYGRLTRARFMTALLGNESL